MTQHPELQEIEVGDYWELLTHLYDFAKKYRDSFEGMASTTGDKREGIFVSVVEGGKKMRFSFLAPTHSSMLSFIKLLDAEGFLHNSFVILPDVIIEVVDARREQHRSEELELSKKTAEKTADKRSASIRWVVGLTVSTVTAIVVAFVTALLTTYYSGHGLDDEIDRLDREIHEIRRTSQRASSVSPAHPEPTTRGVPSKPSSKG